MSCPMHVLTALQGGGGGGGSPGTLTAPGSPGMGHPQSAFFNSPGAQPLTPHAGMDQPWPAFGGGPGGLDSLGPMLDALYGVAADGSPQDR